MGFIEDERRRVAAELEAQRKSQSIREQQRIEQRRREEAEQAAIEAQAAKSKQQFEQSGLGGMIRELTNIKNSHITSRELKGGKSHVVAIIQERSVRGNEVVSAKVFVETFADGTIKIEGAFLFGSTTLSRDEWQEKKGREKLERALGKAYKHPKIKVEEKYTPQDRSGPCLPGNSRISTPNGSVPIKNLKIGDFVWTSDRFGQRVQTVIVNKTKKIASKNHKVAHIVLKDRRELFVSLGHPTIDYRKIGSLVRGDDLDMSSVALIKVMPYKGKYTYDILPYGDTGGYWANNVLIGSTLSRSYFKTPRHSGERSDSRIRWRCWTSQHDGFEMGSSQFQRTISDGLGLFQAY